MTVTSIKVLCVDDNLFVAGALKARIKRLEGYEWIGQLPTADHLVDEAVRLGADVVLLDVDMPGRDPFAALTELSMRCPDMRVLMLSAKVSRTLVDRAIAAGAWGYFSKDDDIESTLSTIVDAVRGDFALGPNAGQRNCIANSLDAPESIVRKINVEACSFDAANRFDKH